LALKDRDLVEGACIIGKHEDFHRCLIAGAGCRLIAALNHCLLRDPEDASSSNNREDAMRE
jgi:hypothetical protein